MSEFSTLTKITESPNQYPGQKDMIKELLGDHEIVIVQLRNDINELTEDNKDAGTADFLTSLMEKHETTAWILRRYLS